MKSDCDLIVTDIEDIFSSFDNCFDMLVDDKKSKMNVTGGVFGFAKSLTKLAVTLTSCAIKNAPKAIVTAAVLKKEVVHNLSIAAHEGQKEFNKFALDLKIQQFKLKDLKND